MERKMVSNKDEVLDFGFEIKKEDVTPDGFFKGYGSTFGGPPDSGNDIIAPGCFRKTIKDNGRNGNGIAMLWSHDTKCPIGTWQVIREDDKGLYVEGICEPDAMPGGVPVLKLMRSGGIKGLSIGYNTKSYSMDETKKVRTLKEVDLWEISPVTFPMNNRAKITSVKAIRDARTARELEQALRDAGVPIDEAKYLTGLLKSGLRDAGGLGAGEMNDILQELKKVNQQMQMDEISNAIRNS
jgi:HK97 family phage prohead protease